jgi:hypothetical protein
MGYYINPEDQNKESWLLENGREVGTPKDLELVRDSECVVCVVDNGLFTAASVIYSENELKAFSLPSDVRPKRWFNVSKEAVVKVSDIGMDRFE